MAPLNPDDIQSIIIHCSDSSDDLDIGKKEVDVWHKARGWDGCGYHFVIRKDGVIEIGRNIRTAGAHVEGMNKYSLGICWMGRTDITESQMHSLKLLVVKLLDDHNLSITDVLGHCEVNLYKTCPNINMDTFRRTLYDLFDDT